jgi:UDP-N-acetylglucosamine:LPS N-acetylglucosamine transferase
MAKKILLMITDAGGGHRGSAESLHRYLAAHRPGWEVRIANAYREVWPKNFGVTGERIYNFVLRHNMILWAGFLRRTAYWMVSHQGSPAVRAAREYFRRERPDLVVSLMPFVNDVYAEALQPLGIPMGLVMTDLLDSRPYMWLTPLASRRAAFVAVGCAQAATQAREQGAGNRVLESGLVIHPRHFDPAIRQTAREAARRRLGLDPNLFTVMILMGGPGSKVIRTFVHQFEASASRWQVLACCGRNEGLRKELEDLVPTLKNRLVPVGFTSDLPLWMRAADLLLTKPGPASILEGAAMGVPLVLDHYQTMPQEIPNTRFVAEHGLGLVVTRRAQMVEILGEVQSQPGRLQALQTRMQGFRARDACPAMVQAMERSLHKTSTKM